MGSYGLNLTFFVIMNQKCFEKTVVVRRSLISLAAVIYLSASVAARAVNLVQEFYLPMPESQIVEAGVQFQDLGLYDHNFGGRSVELDLSKSIFLHAGVSFSF
jgi:hypothetical protein